MKRQMNCKAYRPQSNFTSAVLSRRRFIQLAGGVGATALAFHREMFAALTEQSAAIATADRFPYFRSIPVSYGLVKMQDTYWAPRQETVREVTVPWATKHFDEAGGLDEFKAHPKVYTTQFDRSDILAIRFIESLAAVAGLKRDNAIEELCEAWGEQEIDGQEADGYLKLSNWQPAERWKAVWWSHEDYAIGVYLEAAIGFKETTGNEAMYQSALRAVENMASEFLGSDRAYASGHEEIEQALMRLYGMTGNTKYLRLCGWLIGQRGRHEGRRSFGKYSQDHLPIKAQRTIEGHAVRAAYLFNGVTEYVGATGDAEYREAVLSIWDDFANRKMYLHGAGGNQSAKNEGYSSKPYFIPPNDTYGESCSIFGNFQWAHSLFRLTGDAKYLDTSERMLYNAFYASLSLRGDRFFYRNLVQTYEPAPRFDWHPCPCCPANIVTLFAKVGGYFYATDQNGILIKHYGACQADIPFASGVRLIQSTDYPWDGKITVRVEPNKTTAFALRLRKPGWAKSHTVQVNGETISATSQNGWLTLQRDWEMGDTVVLMFPMEVDRVTMPQEFKEYRNLTALQRGPIVYCLEEEDVDNFFDPLYIPKNSEFIAEYRSKFLGGVTVLLGELRKFNPAIENEISVPAMFVPYGVWGNRNVGGMRMWLPGIRRGNRLMDLLDQLPLDPDSSEATPHKDG
jgi:hypothetical protein